MTLHLENVRRSRVMSDDRRAPRFPNMMKYLLDTPRRRGVDGLRNVRAKPSATFRQSMARNKGRSTRGAFVLIVFAQLIALARAAAGPVETPVLGKCWLGDLNRDTACMGQPSA